MAAKAVDLRAEMLRYAPRQRVPRLMHIRKVMAKADPAMCKEATLLAHEELKTARNTTLYKELTQQMFEAGFDVAVDQAEVTARERAGSQELEAMQVRLGQASNNLAKETVRNTLFEIADFYSSRGDVTNAMKAIARSKDACQTPLHNAELCLKAIQVNLFQDSGPNYAVAAQYAQRAEQFGEALPDQEFIAVRIGAALAHVDRKNYKAAANLLTTVRRQKFDNKKAKKPGQQEAAAKTLEFAPSSAYYFDNSDLVLLLTLLTLATAERPDLVAFLANPDFKVLYESEPRMREALTAFLECEYHQCLGIVNECVTRMKRDVFLSAHAGPLLLQIRQKALKQYVMPFLALDLNKMAQTFHCNVGDLEMELSLLIVRGQIKARIDRANSVLRATHSDPRELALAKAADLADDFHREAETALRTLSMQRNEVLVAHPVRKRGGMGGMGGMGGLMMPGLMGAFLGGGGGF